MSESAHPNDPFALDVLPAQAKAPLLPADIERYVERERLEELQRRGLGAASTLRAYRADWRVFSTWCATRGFTPLPALPLTIARYIRYLIDRPTRVVEDEYVGTNGVTIMRRRTEGPCKPATVARHLVAIRTAHKLRGFDDPTSDVAVKRTERGTRRERGVGPKQKLAVTKDLLVQALRANDAAHEAAIANAKRTGNERAAASRELQRLRDRALLLLGWTGAFRRSELVAIDVADIRDEPLGLHINLRKSKTNQEGQSEFVLIHRALDLSLCAVTAVCAYRTALAAAGVVDGAVFRAVDRHGRIGASLRAAAVADIVKAAALAAGLVPEHFGAHSLRAGWITTGIQAGKTEVALMKHSRHRSIDVFRGYVREADKWRERETLRLL
jgi:integrase